MIEYPFNVDNECLIPKANIVKGVEMKSEVEMIKDATYQWWFKEVNKTRIDVIEKLKRKKMSYLIRLINQKKSVCKSKNVKYDLDIKWYVNELKKGCALTGIEFDMSHINKTNKKCGASNPYQPSIDRINPEKGYIKINCRLILLSLNLFKLNFTDEHMYKISEKLLEFRSDPD